MDDRRFRLRFNLKSIFILMVGIAIGFALNLRTLQVLTGPPSEARMGTLSAYRIEPPDVIQISASGETSTAISSIIGQRLVGPDGTVNLGEFGQPQIAGRTIGEAQAAIESAIASKTPATRIFVNVVSFNSKCYYIVTKGQGRGDRVVRVPMTGHETALDALAQVGGLAAPEATQVWISRPSARGGPEKRLTVDWDAIVNGSSPTTNYQLLPGDRIFIARRSDTASTR